MVKSGSLRTWPVRMRTTISLGLTNPLRAQFLQAGQRDGRSGLAADAVGADLGFGLGDFNFADLLDLAAGRAQHAQRFLP